MSRRAALCLAVACAPTFASRSATAAEAPWRLSRTLDLPPAVELSLEQRSRLELLEGDYRPASDPNSTAFVMRTLLSLTAGGDTLGLHLEGQDSRAYATEATPLNTTSVNALSLLQAHLTLRLPLEGKLEARLGRLTLDLGGRRLVARNHYRNTINGFSGLDLRWTDSDTEIRAFALAPVVRRPTASDRVENNEIQWDRENFDTLLAGAFFRTDLLDSSLEVYGLGLIERDGVFESRNRRLFTPGVRWSRKPTTGSLDFELEAAAQLGRSRASSAVDDRADLEHFAYLVHLETGWSFDAALQPRATFELDYASGDEDPTDDGNGRFDTLYGARRFEWGPTGIYGPFARSNLFTPGLRLRLRPHARIRGFIAYRAYWLASRFDAWTTTGFRDATGSSGRFLGHQPEMRVQWLVLPKNLSLELGVAWFLRRDFARAANPRDGDTLYGYMQLTMKI